MTPTMIGPATEALMHTKFATPKIAPARLGAKSTNPACTPTNTPAWEPIKAVKRTKDRILFSETAKRPKDKAPPK